MVTIFNDLFITDTPFYVKIDEVLNGIKTSDKKDFFKALRNTTDKEKRNDLKKKLKCICFSGTFSKRKAINIVDHSGFACLDFDDVGTYEDAEILRDSLQDNEYIYSAFVSPSGNGVKALVKIPAEIENHKKYYEALCETFDTNIDAKTKDIARVCYESYDPNLFINKDSKEWVLKKDYTEVKNNNVDYPDYFKIKNTSDKVDVIRKWFNNKFTLNAGERNNNLFKLACGLNKAGLPQSEALSMFINFYSVGLNDSELENIIKSAYKNTSDFNTLTLIDDNKVNNVRRIVGYGERKAKMKLKKEGLDNEEIEDLMDFDFDDEYIVFWNTDKNGNIKLSDYKFKLFLENRGFYKVQLNEREFTFVKVTNNVINEVSETTIKDFVLDFIYNNYTEKEYNFFAKSTSKFTDTYLNQLSTRDMNMMRDTEDTSYLFFKNTIVKVTKNKIEYIDYRDCGGLVWQKNIIDREFKISHSKSDFNTFLSNVSNNDKGRLNILETAIGYLLVTYKKQNEGLAIVLYDETLNENPSGRTGKTLISKAIDQLRKVTTLNGKEFSNKGAFPYQTVNLDDNVLCFDDLTRNFKLEDLFSVITGDLTLNKKNLQPIVVPYKHSPKILFTSNYILGGTGDSHDARKIEIELYRHYSKNYEPINEFGKLFFSKDWTDEEWNSFYSYMISNIQKYFRTGLIKPTLSSGKIRKLISNTNEDFVDFCENEFLWSANKQYTTKEILSSYRQSDREMPRNMGLSWFGRWLALYFDFKDYKREDKNYNGKRSFALKGLDIVEEITDNVPY